jgi:hypothetical protein
MLLLLALLRLLPHQLHDLCEERSRGVGGRGPCFGPLRRSSPLLLQRPLRRRRSGCQRDGRRCGSGAAPAAAIAAARHGRADLCHDFVRFDGPPRAPQLRSRVLCLGRHLLEPRAQARDVGDVRDALPFERRVGGAEGVLRNAGNGICTVLSSCARACVRACGPCRCEARKDTGG